MGRLKISLASSVIILCGFAFNVHAQIQPFTAYQDYGFVKQPVKVEHHVTYAEYFDLEGEDVDEYYVSTLTRVESTYIFNEDGNINELSLFYGVGSFESKEFEFENGRLAAYYYRNPNGEIYENYTYGTNNRLSEITYADEYGDKKEGVITKVTYPDKNTTKAERIEEGKTMTSYNYFYKDNLFKAVSETPGYYGEIEKKTLYYLDGKEVLAIINDAIFITVYENDLEVRFKAGADSPQIKTHILDKLDAHQIQKNSDYVTAVKSVFLDDNENFELLSHTLYTRNEHGDIKYGLRFYDNEITEVHSYVYKYANGAESGVPADNKIFEGLKKLKKESWFLK